MCNSFIGPHLLRLDEVYANVKCKGSLSFWHYQMIKSFRVVRVLKDFGKTKIPMTSNDQNTVIRILMITSMTNLRAHPKGCPKKTATFSKIECNYYCPHNGILSLLINSNIFIWLEVMLLMTKYSNEVSFIDLVNIQIQLNNFKCCRFFGDTLYMESVKSNAGWLSLLIQCNNPSTCLWLPVKWLLLR